MNDANCDHRAFAVPAVVKLRQPKHRIIPEGSTMNTITTVITVPSLCPLWLNYANPNIGVFMKGIRSEHN